MVAAINHITFDCANPEVLGLFWADVLGLVSHVDNESGDPEWYVYDPSGRVPSMLFIAVPEAKRGKNRIHLDLQPLIGQKFSADLLREAVQCVRAAAQPMPDVRGSAAYKREMAVEFAARALITAWQRAAPERSPGR